MIISHRFRFIFIKTAKTAGTSVEVFLGNHCGEEDVITPTYPEVEGHRPRNDRKFFWPFPEVFHFGGPWDRSIYSVRRFFTPRRTLSDCFKRRRYHEHIPAWILRQRVPPEIWNSYHKFAIERNPWDKTLSHYHMQRSTRGGGLSLEEYFADGVFCLNHPFYLDDQGAMMVDQIIKYENLNADFGALCERLGIPWRGSLGVRAKGDYRKDRRPYTEVLTPEQATRISDIFQREIALHGYQYGDS